LKEYQGEADSLNEVVAKESEGRRPQKIIANVIEQTEIMSEKFMCEVDDAVIALLTGRAVE
jgi:hypothetical protein